MTTSSSSSGSSVDRHVGVLVFPMHAATLLKLVRRLVSAAPTTTFSFFNSAKVNTSLFTPQPSHGLHNLRVYDVADGGSEDTVIPADSLIWIESFMRATPRNFYDAMQRAEAEIGRTISCLVSDALLWFTADVAQERRVPWVAIQTAALSCLCIHLHTDAIRKAVEIAGQPKDQTLDFIPGLSAIKVEDLPEGIVFRDKEVIFMSTLNTMARMMPRATMVVGNTFEGLEPTLVVDDLRSKLRKVVAVGPLDLSSPPPLISDPSGCLPWLDKQSETSVAYVSFGSLVTPPPEEIVALAEALEATGMPFLLSLKENALDNLPKGFLARTMAHGKVVSWAPQPQVLDHASIAVFITHGGWNSVIESVVGGVPVICRPFFGEHRLNRWMVENVWGIGLGIEGGILTRAGIMSALALVLSHEGKKMREKIGILKEFARRAVEPTGSSTHGFNNLLDVITTSQSHSGTNK